MAEVTHAPPSGPSIALSALVAALTRFPAALMLWGFELLLALGPAMAQASWTSSSLAGKREVRELFANFDAVARFDLRASLAELERATGQMGAVLALLALLGGCFAAGGWCQCFLEPAWESSARTFVRGGARFFARNVRVLVLSLCLFAALGWLCYGWPWNKLVLGLCFHVPESAVDGLGTLRSENLALGLRIAQQSLFGLGFALVLTSGDYLRAALARRDRRGVIGEALEVLGQLVRHPVLMLRSMLALFLLEALIVTGGGLFVQRLQATLEDVPRLRTVALMGALAAIVLLCRCVVRGARYHAALRVLRELEHSPRSAPALQAPAASAAPLPS